MFKVRIKIFLASFVVLVCMNGFADSSKVDNTSTGVIELGDIVLASAAIHFVQPWTTVTTDVPKIVTTSKMYTAIINSRERDVNLVNISSDVLHEIRVERIISDRGVMRREEVEFPIAIKGGINIDLKSCGIHIILTNPKRPFRVGDTVAVTFYFEDNTHKTVNVKVANDNPYGAANRTCEGMLDKCGHMLQEKNESGVQNCLVQLKKDNQPTQWSNNDENNKSSKTNI